MRGRVAVAVAAVAMLGLTPIGGVASRAATTSLISYGADAAGTGVHVLGSTNNFTNFATGFLDNSYPLASTHLDAGPASQATATVLDTGPLGTTAEGVAKPPVTDNTPFGFLVAQPQYAVATYPGRTSDSTGQGLSVATALALQNSAEAHGALSSVGTGGSVEKPTDAGRGAADEASSAVTVDPDGGKVRSSSSGYVRRAAFGGGALVISGVEVQASVDATGSDATPHYSVAVESATVNGTPVAITDKGVVAQDPVPGSDVQNQIVNEQLNAALAGAGLKVFATAPKVTRDGPQATVEVSGVHVSYVAPNPDPSVPTLTYDYILGEARAFAFAVPDESGDFEDVSAGSAESSGSGEISSDFGSTSGAIEALAPESLVGGISQGGSSTPGSVRALPASFHRPRPTWLVPIYIIWQALMIATGFVLVWSRREADG
jgi:hypothetical protein